MKKYGIIVKAVFPLSIVILLLFIVEQEDIYAQQFSNRPEWEDNFSINGRVDSSNWNYHVGKFKNDEEYYTDSIGNVFVKNGKLHIVATKDSRYNSICSSGRINTLGKKSFLYGKLEIKAKIPTGLGIFPAIWMLREDHPRTFPLGEIDIMEYIECFNKNIYCTTTHIVEKVSGDKELRHRHSKRVSANMNKYHIYSLEWTPKSLVFKLDRKVVYRLDKDEAEYWPFDDPYYLILNVAYGNWGFECGRDDSIFPKEMLVDWIRYYPLKNN